MANLKDQQNALDAMRAKMRSQAATTSKFKYFKPNEGRTLIRILPPVGDMQFFWQPVGKHDLSGDGKNTVVCPNFTTEGELPCPICEMSQAAYDQGQAELSKALKVRRNYHMNVIVRSKKDDDDDADANVSAQIWTAGLTVFRELTEIVYDPDYGDISHPYSGFDVRVTRTGQKLDTEYSCVARRTATPIFGSVDAPNEELIQNVLGSAKDLSTVRNDIKSYEELAKMLQIDPASEHESDDDEDDFPED